MAAKGRSRRAAKESPDANLLLVMELQQIHSAETQLARALPRLTRAVESQALRQLIEQRQEEGDRILKELEAAFDELEESPGRRRNTAAEGLINDTREHVQEIESGPALDAVLIAGIQKTEHYCIAAWGTARSLAEALDQKMSAKAMERALQEGKGYDERLTELAERELTPALVEAGSAEDESETEDEDEAAPGARRSGRRNGGAERRTQS